MKKRAVTIYDIARELGLSASTVSRALSGHPKVRQQTRERVQALAEAYQFRPSQVAKGLEGGNTRLLAVVLPSIAQPYYAELLSGAEEEAQAHGYSLLARQILGGSIGKEGLDELISRRPRGLLFIGGIMETMRETLPVELALLHSNMPVVAISAPIPGFSCVYMRNDLENATRHAVEHLKRLGHRAIAFIGGASQFNQSGARERGFQLGLGEVALKAPEFERHEAGFTPEAGELAVLNLFGGRDPQGWPTALVAVNDLVALGAMRQLARMGVRVPEDVAITGCDNQVFSAYTHPPLTTIDLQASDHAKNAIRVLLNPQLTSKPGFTQLRDAPLIVRESCGAQLGPRILPPTRAKQNGSPEVKAPWHDP